MSRTRVSRGLIAGIGAVIVIGGVAYLNKVKDTHAADDPKKVVEANAAAPNNGAKPQAAGGGATPAPAPAKPKSTGQIALPGSASALVTQTPASPANTATPAPAPAKPQAATDVKPTATSGENKIVAAAVKATAVKRSSADPASSAKFIADGKAKIEGNDLLGGRNLLNAALTGGQLTDADEQTAKELIAKANETIIYSQRRFAEDTFTGIYTVQAGDRPGKIAVMCNTTWDFLGRINGIKDAKRLRQGQSIKTIKGPFHAVVSKSRFTMDLYLGSPGEKGSLYVRSFNVGLGRNGTTPTGTWMLSPQGKLKDPKWWGTPDEPAKEAGDPLNPLGKFWMALTGTDGEALGREGFGVHGTADPDSIGKEMSHGCIRLINEDVGQVYEMLIDGKSTVIVRE